MSVISYNVCLWQPFQPGLIFVYKASAYPSEETFKHSTLW